MKLRIVRGVKNLIKWFPIIWKDRDFDRDYLYDIMYFKMSNMEEFFKYGRTYSVDAKIYGEQIGECKNLLKRVKDEIVVDEHWDSEKGYDIPIEEIGRLYKEEKHKLWSMIEKNIDEWWD